MSTYRFALMMLLLAAVPSTVWAQDGDLAEEGVGATEDEASEEEVDAEADARARELFETGREAFDRGEYEVALATFRQAYSLRPFPALLYNIGTAADRLRRDEDALQAFERYLELAPADASNRPGVERRVEILRRNVREASESDEGVEQVPPPPIVEDSGADRADGTPFVIGGGVLMGVAAISAGVAVGTWVASESAYSDLEMECATGCSDERIDESGVATLDTLTNVFLVTSIATGAAGVALLLVGLMNGGEEEEALVQALVGPAYVGVRGAF